MRQVRCSGHDNERPLPWSLIGNERVPLHPASDALGSRLAGGYARCISPLDDPQIGLHPDHGVNEMRGLAPSGAHAFDDDKGGVRRRVDHPSTAALIPCGRPKATARP